MRKYLKKIRKSKITKEEIIADLIFLIIAFTISVVILFLFDIHWSFYDGNTLFPPSAWVGIGKNNYIIGGLAGAIIGFFIIKLFLFGIKEEEKIWNRKKK